MKKRTLPLLLTFLFVSIAVIGQSKVDKIEKLMQTYYDYGQFNGSILVAEKDQVLFKGGFGEANKEWDIPNKANTKHRLGSITKQFTAMLILQLKQEGKLDLQKPITTYLPYYPAKTGDIITTHHLLSHTSGIPNYTAFPNYFEEQGRDPKTPKEFIKIFQDKPLDFEPGSKYNYSNSAYFLLGVLIEEITRESYAENLQKRILTPLDMNESGYDLSSTVLKNRASGYGQNHNGFVNAPYLDMSLPYAAGSMYATVEDLYKWDQALYNHTILSEENTKLLFKPAIELGTNNSYAYGFMVGKSPIGNTEDRFTASGHGGGIHGFNTIIMRDEDQHNLVVLLNNTGGTNLNEMSTNIMAILYGKSYDMPKKSLVSEIKEQFEKNGIEKTIAELSNFTKSDHVRIDEGDINRFGYELLTAKEIDAAIAVFKLNVSLFPESSNTYDSLGEAYLNANKKEESIANYTKSLELNSDNRGGIEALKKLGADVSKFEKEIIVSEDILESYTGKYELMPNFFMTISRTKHQLHIQATGQGVSDIYPSTEVKFYSKIVNAQLTFNKDETGAVVSLTLHQGGDHLAKKIE
ncbi:serine hydrolase [Urechidicola vernalis]|uniref:Serine hydrolase n=1 Tax=Urechidicola vernalis TaxID=3075600 RepID=A0ABU2Y8F0_9FLAO|nr:serine hydrolase [Urechidicola sp. P050]MDT0554085.1 serine hydrolase [Urechidicola sp. P050]